MSANVDPIFQDILKRMENVTEPRWSRQERLEQLLSDFNPDYQEIYELLDALFSSFKHRYSDGEWDRADIALEEFKDKLHLISELPAHEPDYEPDDPE